MPRFIDAEMACAEVDKGDLLVGNNADFAKEIIRRTPSADVVGVTRCKDCVHYRNHPNGLCDCWTEPYANERGYKGDMHCVEPDDYCSFGERKE